MAMNFLYSDDSALVGAVPNNQDDWYVINGLFRDFGIDGNPSLGYPYAPTAPVGYVHESEQAGIIAGMSIVLAVIVLPTMGRIIAKTRSKSTVMGLDDYTIVVAAILSAMYPILVIVMTVTAGGGLHTWEVTYADYQRFYYYLSVCKILFYVSVGMIKVSITLFVRRLANGASRTWQILADIFLATLVIYILAALFWCVFLCSPQRSIWDKWYAGTLAEAPRCADINLNSRVLSIIHSIQGVILLLAPIVILWRVRINLAKKIRLFVIWAAGAVTVTFGLLQLISTGASTDIFWIFTKVLRWTTLDLAMGILTACLPVLDSAIMGAWDSVKSATGRSGYEHHPDAYTWGNSRVNTRVTTRTDPPLDDSESVENMIRKDDGLMMSILRTDEVHVGHENKK
ncbi:hypothetical protein BX600DRAFT_551231 [Xylariales sp. PMI_506]|nr:hypothetical protein BX600DRAFT_551231 [Xylariales sp. PMI_506]